MTEVTFPHLEFIVKNNIQLASCSAHLRERIAKFVTTQEVLAQLQASDEYESSQDKATVINQQQDAMLKISGHLLEMLDEEFAGDDDLMDVTKVPFRHKELADNYGIQPAMLKEETVKKIKNFNAQYNKIEQSEYESKAAQKKDIDHAKELSRVIAKEMQTFLDDKLVEQGKAAKGVTEKHAAEREKKTRVELVFNAIKQLVSVQDFNRAGIRLEELKTVAEAETLKEATDWIEAEKEKYFAVKKAVEAKEFDNAEKLLHPMKENQDITGAKSEIDEAKKKHQQEYFAAQKLAVETAVKEKDFPAAKNVLETIKEMPGYSDLEKAVDEAHEKHLAELRASKTPEIYLDELTAEGKSEISNKHLVEMGVEIPALSPVPKLLGGGAGGKKSFRIGKYELRKQDFIGSFSFEKAGEKKEQPKQVKEEKEKKPEATTQAATKPEKDSKAKQPEEKKKQEAVAAT